MRDSSPIGIVYRATGISRPWTARGGGAVRRGKISSDSGGLLLREVEQRTNSLKRLAGCFVDHGDVAQIEPAVLNGGWIWVAGEEIKPFDPARSTEVE